MKKSLFILLFVFFSGSSYAITSDMLMEKALLDGKAEGVLDGPIAKGMQMVTHSTSDPYMSVVRENKTKDGCYFILQTVTVPHVPAKSGIDLGDFVSSTRLQICPNGEKPKDGHFLQVVSCTVGGRPCPKPTQ